RVAPGQHILLDAERRNIEAVDHILRSHDELDVASHRDMQFVDLALTFGVLHLPHPLLRHNVNFSRVGGWRALFEVNDGAPGKDHHKDEKRNRAPGDFQSSRTLDLFSANARTMTEPGRKKYDQDKHQQ